MNEEWDTNIGESDPTYQQEKTSSVFIRLPKHHEAYRPRIRATYNPSVEHDYGLIYRPAAERSKFMWLLEIYT
ncbi:hypothetical protein HanPI659440_Chr00c01g0704441 [Helianthus annuus]|nr:hypothetical protein HanPI659440_Chr00c01g0704441 [Helianthus annuus]